MSLQEAMDFFRQLSSNSFSRGNLLHARLAQAINGAKLAQHQIFPVLTHARAIIENAFTDAFFHEQLMIGVSETVGLVANSLEQSQRAGVDRQLQRQAPARPINLFMLLGQADDRQIMKTESLQFSTRGRKLALPAIDDDQIRQTNERHLVFIAVCSLDVERSPRCSPSRAKAGWAFASLGVANPQPFAPAKTPPHPDSFRALRAKSASIFA